MHQRLLGDGLVVDAPVDSWSVGFGGGRVAVVEVVRLAGRQVLAALVLERLHRIGVIGTAAAAAAEQEYHDCRGRQNGKGGDEEPRVAEPEPKHSWTPISAGAPPPARALYPLTYPR